MRKRGEKTSKVRWRTQSARIALGTLAELFRDRAVISIHAVDLVWGLGTIHCLTREQPRRIGN